VYGLYVSSGARDSHGAMWIGASDDPAEIEGTAEGVWEWSDGNGIAFSSWSPGEPNDWGSGQDCGVMWKDDKSWDDQGCDGEKPFVCAVETGAGQPPPPQSFASHCNELHGVHAEGSEKCFFAPEATASWPQAESDCKAQGGHLASILSAEENDLVYGLYVSSGARDSHGAMWIGASDDPAEIEGTAEGVWEWSDGNGIAFSSWSPGEPNDWGSGQDCGVMWKDDKSWDDQGCDGEKPYVCEWTPPPPGPGGGTGGIGASPEVATSAINAGAHAVNAVHEFFKTQKQESSYGWAPGDTQNIATLPTLGKGANGEWSGNTYHTQGAAGVTVQWTPGQPHPYRHDPDQKPEGDPWHHFKVVTHEKERFEMSKPGIQAPNTQGGKVPYKVPDLTPFHTAAYTMPAFTQPGGPGAPTAASPASPASEPGFIVSTTDDSPGLGGGASTSTSAKPPAMPISVVSPPLPVSAGSTGIGMVEEPVDTLAKKQLVMSVENANPSGIVAASGVAYVPSAGASVVAQGPPVQMQYTLTPQQQQVKITMHKPAAAAPSAGMQAEASSLPELSRIPELPKLKYFDSGPAESAPGKFKHWDGKTLQVLNVVPEKSGGAIDLDPHNWYMPKPPVVTHGYASPLEHMQFGSQAAEQAKNHFVAGDRAGVAYRTFGEVGPAVGESEEEHAAHSR